jgi:K+-transporting ATPase ATPase C chain
MGHYILTSIRASLVTLVLLGLLYPLLMTGLGLIFFPFQARGSLIHEGNHIGGSVLIGQNFVAPAYFHPRPSAAGAGYDPLFSSGSNFGPTSKALHDRVAKDVLRVRAENPGMTQVPVDMVTASGSGLDPDITPAAALAQVTRVAQARHLTVGSVQQLVTQHTQGRQFGFLGERRVNVLQLNRALDQLR